MSDHRLCSFYDFCLVLADLGGNVNPSEFDKYTMTEMIEYTRRLLSTGTVDKEFWACVPKAKYGLLYQLATTIKVPAPPPPVVTPFTELVSKEDWGVRMDACDDLSDLLNHGVVTTPVMGEDASHFRVEVRYDHWRQFKRRYNLFYEPNDLSPWHYEHKGERRSYRTLVFHSLMTWLRQLRRSGPRGEVDHVSKTSLSLLLNEYSRLDRQPILEAGYESSRGHIDAIRYRLPLVVELVSQVPQGQLCVAVGDGLGVVAIACLLTGRAVYSVEPGGIGDLADVAGILSGRETFQEFDQSFKASSDDVFFFLNTSIYFDIPSSYAGRFFVILEQRQYDFSALCPEVPNTYKRLWSNVVARATLVDPPTYPRFEKNVRDVVSPRDSMAKEACEALGLRVGEGGRPIAFNMKTIVTPQDYNISERKVAEAPAGKFGQNRITLYDIVPFNEDDHIEFIKGGYRFVSDVPYARGDVLRGYNFNGRSLIAVRINRDPQLIRLAYDGPFLVRVRLVSHKLVRSRYHAVFHRCEGRLIVDEED